MVKKTPQPGIFIFFILILVSPAYCKAQLYFGAEFGSKNEIYKLTDPGHTLAVNNAVQGPVLGLLASKPINASNAIETGLIFNQYLQGYSLLNQGMSYSTDALFALQVPLRLKSSVYLLNRRLKLSGILGVHYAFNTNSIAKTTGDFHASGQNFSYDGESSTSTSTHNYILLEGGTGIQYILKKGFSFGLRMSYLSGIKPIVEQQVRYTVNGKPEQTASLVSSGGYISKCITLGYYLDKKPTKKTGAKPTNTAQPRSRYLRSISVLLLGCQSPAFIDSKDGNVRFGVIPNFALEYDAYLYHHEKYSLVLGVSLGTLGYKVKYDYNLPPSHHLYNTIEDHRVYDKIIDRGLIRGSIGLSYRRHVVLAGKYKVDLSAGTNLDLIPTYILEDGVDYQIAGHNTQQRMLYVDMESQEKTFDPVIKVFAMELGQGVVLGHSERWVLHMIEHISPFTIGKGYVQFDGNSSPQQEIIWKNNFGAIKLEWLF